MTLPTPETYEELQHAYDFFDERLFNNELPPCLITLQRESVLTAIARFSASRAVRTGKWSMK